MILNRTRGRAPLLALAAILAACGGDPSGPPPEPLVITTTSLPDGIRDQPYSAGLNAEGGRLEYDWTIASGSLPPGLVFSIEDLPDGDDIVISGIPETAGSFTFTVQVTSDDGQTATRQLTIRIQVPQALAIENAALPPVVEGGLYDVQLQAVGGPSTTYTWAITAGSLPPGLALVEGGMIQGTPTATDTATITVQVTSGSETTSRQYQIVVVANRTATYDITPVAVTPIPVGIQPHVDEAIAEWQAAITGDLGAVTIPAGQFSDDACSGYGELVNGTTVEDIMVLISIAEIDGPGQILGRAGPCIVRTGDSSLPVIGILILDSADLLPMVGTQTLTHIIFHEIGHTLGFGSLWEGLLTGEGTANPRFTGAAAVAAWQALGGTGDVPVENTGGEGTAGSHWEEEIFDREIMTGFSEAVGVFQPLSRVTIGSMADLGYQVDYGAADSFALGFASLLAPGAAMANLGYDVLLGERIRYIDERYTPVQLRTRMEREP